MKLFIAQDLDVFYILLDILHVMSYSQDGFKALNIDDLVLEYLTRCPSNVPIYEAFLKGMIYSDKLDCLSDKYYSNDHIFI